MPGNEVNLPPGKPWPPADPQAFVDEITNAAKGRRGKHWAVQVQVENPISGYKVVFKQTGPGDP